MSVFIKGMKKPENCEVCPYPFCHLDTRNCPIREIPEKHGPLVDINELSRIMYHNAFESDTDMQKWDGGCWIRYKMFENSLDEVRPLIQEEYCE